jgi:hypothetical protein
MCPACDGWAVERGTVATGKMRVSIGLTVAGAVLLMVGVITVFVGEVMRLKSPHGWQGTVGLGEVVAACGLGCGLALLVVAGRPGRRRLAARSRPAWRARSAGPLRSASRTPSEGVASAEGTPSSAATWRPSGRPDSLAGSAAHLASGDAWRQDSAEEWLSPLRNPVAPHAPEPAHWSGEPIQEFSPALDYSDDGWGTENATGFVPEPRPPQPPARTRGGAHRATGATGPQSRYETRPGIEQPADTTLARFS